MAWEERRKQELELIKQLPPELVLDRLQVPWKRVGSQIMAQAVWRGERHPSVSIQQKGGVWLWRDHGVPPDEPGAGGSWIDLVQVARNLSYVEAVRELRSWMREVWGADWDLLSSPDVSAAERPRQARIVRAGSVQHPALRRYLHERGIRLRNLPPWLREVHWEVEDPDTGERKHYFGLGVKNINGGWLVRNPLWKGAVLAGGPAVAGETPGNERRTLAVVEGIFDALAVRQAGVGRDFLILGGSGNIAAGLDLIETLRPQEVVLALEGLNAERILLARLPDGILVKRLDIGPHRDPAEALSSGWNEWNLIEVEVNPWEMLTRSRLSFKRQP